MSALVWAGADDGAYVRSGANPAWVMIATMLVAIGSSITGGMTCVAPLDGGSFVSGGADICSKPNDSKPKS